MAEQDDALEALRLFADDERLRVIAALVLGARSTGDVVAVTDLPQRRVLQALTRLESGGLVVRQDGDWRFDVPRLNDLAKHARPRPEPDDVGDVDRETAAVLRTFLRGGRLTQIPMQRNKRLVVLDHICRVFDIGVRYPEREVNAFLRAFHPDTAALRRYLVDEGFLSREHNVYWRTGGTVDLR
ncbi:MAG TPA: DUF2087 domain-containing protein [Mycobacteriales bacterium]|nr:DUF2087 domain-containing protein [Mycobacteriales bacterium]